MIGYGLLGVLIGGTVGAPIGILLALIWRVIGGEAAGAETIIGWTITVFALTVGITVDITLTAKAPEITQRPIVVPEKVVPEVGFEPTHP